MQLRLLSILLCLAGLFGLPDRAFAATRTWDGGGANDNWTNAANWVGNVAPVAGDSLVFPAGFEGATINNFPIDTVFGALTAAGGYTLSGNRVVVGLDIRAVPGAVSGVVLIQLAINLIDAPATHTITMTADSGAELSVTGVVHGPPSATLRKRGPGILTLQVANLYAGLTVIEAGRLVIRSSAALGSNTSNTMVLEGGTLELQVGGATITEPLMLLGDAAENDPNGHAALVALENATWSAPITLQGAGAPLIRVPAVGVTLTVSSVISGSEGLEIDGRGSLRMTGVSSNTYFGMTTVWPGTLVLDKSAGAVAVPAGLVINGLSPLVALVSLEQLEQIQGTVAVNRAGRLDLNGRNETIGALSLMGGEVKTGTGVLTLGGNITVVQSTALALISGKLSLGADTRTLEVQGADSPVIDISAVISSPQQQGLIKTGPGFARLSGANTYAGPTMVLDGALRAAHSSAFGDAVAGISLAPSSRLEIEVDVPLEPLYTEGGPNFLKPTLAVVAANLCTWGGPIVISGRLRTYTNPSGPLRLSGVISGTGELRMAGAGIVELGGDNVYAGNTIVGAPAALKSSHRIPDSSRVELQAGPLNLAGFDETVGGIWGGPQGQILFGGGALTVITQPGNTDVYAGTFVGNGSVTKMGAGTWVLAGTSASTAPITVAAGTLRVTGSLAHLMTVQGGTLEGTGSVGGIVAASGTVRPGAGLGVLDSKSVTLGAGVSLAIAINGPAAGTEHAQLDVTGSVNLGSAVLALAVIPSFLPAGAGDLVIVANDGSDPIIGTFSGLPEGTTIDAGNGKTFRITYAGGSGNDVVLTALSDNSYYLSEGATGSFFDLDVLIANPNTADAPVTLTFLREDGGVVVEHRTVPGRQRITLRVDDIAGVEDTPVSTVVKSDDGLPLIVERTMRWDQSGYGAHTEKAAGGTALTWYFAEGSQGFFSTYLLLANPGTSPSMATVQYLREGLPALVRAYPIAAGSRFTVNAGADPELVNTSFGMIVTFDQPGIAERAMYFGADPVWKGGHESAGVTAPSMTWFLAEGATGPFFETFVLLANPNGDAAEATLTFLTSDGAPIVRQKTVPANGRLTVNIESEDPALANAPVSTKIDATLPVIVERAQYWPDPAPAWYEAHNSFGVTAAGTKWGLAEGRVGGGDAAYQTYILIANPGASQAAVAITFLLEGGAPVTKTFNVPPASRFNVSTGTGTMAPELENQRFGAVITSDQPIVVERAMYSNAGGQTWAAGTNATATRLP